MAKEEFKDWHTDSCDRCHRLAHEYGLLKVMDEKPTKWMCVGRIRRKRGATNPHEKHNTIRMCILKEEEIHEQNWTTWEAQRAAMALIWAVSCKLIKRQPRKETNP